MTTVSELRKIMAEVKDQYAAGDISEAQYKAFMRKAREHGLYHTIEDPVWEKPVRPITKPRPNKKSKYNDLHIDASTASL